VKRIFIALLLMTTAVAIVQADANQPVNFSLSYPGGNSVYLSWYASDTYTAISGYDVYRSEGDTSNFIPITTTSNTSYIDADINTNLAYFYTIDEFDTNNNYSTLTVIQPSRPYPPNGTASIVKSSYNSKVFLSWSNSSDENISAYNIYRSSDAVDYVAVALSISANSFVDMSVYNDVNYSYKIASINTQGPYLVVPVTTSPIQVTVSSQGPYSIDLFAKPLIPPFPPAGPFTQTVSGNTITLSWAQTFTAGTFDTTYYEIYRSTYDIVPGPSTGDAFDILAFPAPVACTGCAAQNTYNYSGLTSGATNYFSIYTVDSMGDLSIPAGGISCYVPGIIPVTPTGLTVTAANLAGVTLNWNANPAGDATYYGINRGTTPASLPQLATTTDQSYTDATGGFGTQYFYTVTAYNSLNNSSQQSVTVSAVMLPAPPASFSAVANNPTGLTSVVDVSLSWYAANSTDNINTYNIYKTQTYSDLTVTPIKINPIYAYSVTYSAQVTWTAVNYSYTDLTVSPGVYYYTALAVTTSAVMSMDSAIACITVTAAPGAVILTGTAYNSYNVLSWTAISNPAELISFYNVYRGITLTSLSNITATTQTSYADTGLNTYTPYYYVVTAVNINGLEGPMSGALMLQPSNNIKPNTPSLNAECYGDGTINLTWTQDYDPGIYYNVYRSTYSSGQPITWVPVTSTSNNISNTINAYVDPVMNTASAQSVGNTLTYYYSIQALNVSSTAASNFSNIASATVFVEPYPVQNLVASNVGTGVLLTWENPGGLTSFPLSGYNIFRSTTAGGFGPTPINFLTYPSNSYTDPAGLTLSTSSVSPFYYQVKMVDTQGNSDNSQYYAQINFDSVLLPPPVVVAYAQPSQVTLEWQILNAKISQYNIYRSTISGIYGAPIVSNNNPLDRQYIDTSVNNGIKYYYTVSAVNDAGEGAKSLEVSAEPYWPLLVPLNVPPQPPENLPAGESIEQINKKDIFLTWAPAISSTTDKTFLNQYYSGYTTPYASSFSFSYYCVSRSSDNGGTYNFVTMLPGLTNTAFVDNTTSWATDYLYKVAAVDSAGNGDAIYPIMSQKIPSPVNKLRVYRNLLDLSKGQTLQLQYEVIQTGNLKVYIYTLSGKMVKKVLDIDIAADATSQNPYDGQYFYWDGTNSAGQKVASGVYIIMMEFKDWKNFYKVAVVK